MSGTNGTRQYSEADQIAIGQAMEYADTEAVAERKRERQAQRVAYLEGQVQNLSREVFQLRTALEGATTMMNELGRRLDAEMKARWGRDEIETVCAWCPTPTHISGPVGADAAHTSHGICPQCLEREFPETVTA